MSVATGFSWVITWCADGKSGTIQQYGGTTRALALAAAQNYVRSFGVYGEYSVTLKDVR